MCVENNREIASLFSWSFLKIKRDKKGELRMSFRFVVQILQELHWIARIFFSLFVNCKPSFRMVLMRNGVHVTKRPCVNLWTQYPILTSHPSNFPFLRGLNLDLRKKGDWSDRSIFEICSLSIFCFLFLSRTHASKKHQIPENEVVRWSEQKFLCLLRKPEGLR